MNGENEGECNPECPGCLKEPIHEFSPLVYINRRG